MTITLTKPTPSAHAEGMNGRPPDPEVSAKPTRRRLTIEYKLRILKEADRATAPGQIGALLRREGLYSSHLTGWRRQRKQGTLGGRPRGRKPTHPMEVENEALRAENERLTRRLAQAEMVIEVQKKLSRLLGIAPETPGRGET